MLLQRVELLSTLYKNLSQPATTWFVARQVWTWVVKRATSLLNSFYSNVAKQVTRFCCPFTMRQSSLKVRHRIILTRKELMKKYMSPCRLNLIHFYTLFVKNQLLSFQKLSVLSNRIILFSTFGNSSPLQYCQILWNADLGRFPFVRTDRSDYFRRNENFTLNQSYPAISVQS